LGLNPGLFEPFLKEYLIVIQAILNGFLSFNLKMLPAVYAGCN
jgi:hypothetical protein